MEMSSRILISSRVRFPLCSSPTKNGLSCYAICPRPQRTHVCGYSFVFESPEGSKSAYNFLEKATWNDVVHNETNFGPQMGWPVPHAMRVRLTGRPAGFFRQARSKMVVVLGRDLRRMSFTAEVPDPIPIENYTVHFCIFMPFCRSLWRQRQWAWGSGSKRAHSAARDRGPSLPPPSPL